MNNALASQPKNSLKDGLLRTTIAILSIIRFLSAAAGGIFAVMIASMWLFPSVAEKVLNTPGSGTLLSNTALFLTSAVTATMSFVMFGHLVKVVKTVAEGNAFTSENAERLRKIAYLSLGILASEFVMAWISYFYHESTRDGVPWFDWDPSSIITILVLFVLARVFEEGVRLNDEAQFTV
jgi:hypothetical protein